MICYRDMTFCARTDCGGYGRCLRALTEDDKRSAERCGLPVAMSAFTECFVEPAVPCAGWGFADNGAGNEGAKE